MKIVIDDNSCYFDTNANIKTIFIHYTGKGFIEDKTPQEYVLFLKNNVIIIHNNINTSPNIKNLFDYSGSIGIKHCFVIYLNGDRANIGVKSKKDPYVSDNLILKSESMTLLSEEMKNKDIVKVKKSSLKIKTLNVPDVYPEYIVLLMSVEVLLTSAIKSVPHEKETPPPPKLQLKCPV